jgi:hypothetical protein
MDVHIYVNVRACECLNLDALGLNSRGSVVGFRGEGNGW